MQRTIWLEALRRQLFARNIGSFPKGFIIDMPKIMKKRKTKNYLKNNIEIIDVTKIITMGKIMAKDVAPVGVILR